MQEYASAGGKQDYFNRWMHDRRMAATESTLQKLYEQNDSYTGRYYQRIMGADMGQSYNSVLNPQTPDDTPEF